MGQDVDISSCVSSVSLWYCGRWYASCHY